MYMAWNNIDLTSNKKDELSGIENKVLESERMCSTYTTTIELFRAHAGEFAKDWSQQWERDCITQL